MLEVAWISPSLEELSLPTGLQETLSGDFLHIAHILL
jgi:hypothetical protein